MRELASDRWHWKPPHLDWEAGEPWDKLVTLIGVDGLRPVLELPVERVLPAHGGSSGRAALEHALAGD